MKRREPQPPTAPAPAPASMPVAAEVLAVADDLGRLMVTVDGAVVTASPIGRAAFGALVDELLRRRGRPVSLVLIEADGSRYTDTLHPTPTAPPQPPASPTTARAERPAADVAPPTPVGASERAPAVQGEAFRAGVARVGGFIPGEAVGVAQITMHQSADTDGRVPMLDEPIPDGVEVALIGRISGTLLLLPAPE